MKVGIIVNESTNCSFETIEICKKCVENRNLEELYIFELYGKNLKKKERLSLYFKRGIPWLFRSLLITLIFKIEKIFAKKFSKNSHFLEKYDLNLLQTDKTRFVKLKVLFSKSGYLSWIENEKVEYIKKLNLEFIVNSGGGIWSGEILNCTKKGIFSFHHGDNSINRGGPPGFWEVFYKNDFTGFTIQKLNERLDDGKVIAKGFTTTQRFWINNQLTIRNAALREFKRICDKTLNGRDINYQKREFGIYSNRLYKNPMLSEIFIYLVSKLKFLLKKSFYLLINKKPQWRTLFLKTNNWKTFELRKGKMVKADKNHFLADPHIVSIDGKNYIFLEDYNYSSSKAEIICFKICEDLISVHKVGSAILEKYHVSFPFTFFFNGNLYLSVESSSQKNINIYKRGDDILSWKIISQPEFQSLIPVDPLIFEMNNKWWLIFGNLESLNEMYIFYTNDPINGEWKSHNQNPVYISSHLSRNGGLIFDQGKIYRIAQQSGFNNYGKSMKIMKISELSEDLFIEEEVEFIYGKFNKLSKGVHTLSKSGEFIAFDYWF